MRCQKLRAGQQEQPQGHRAIQNVLDLQTNSAVGTDGHYGCSLAQVSAQGAPTPHTFPSPLTAMDGTCLGKTTINNCTNQQYWDSLLCVCIPCSLMCGHSAVWRCMALCGEWGLELQPHSAGEHSSGLWQQLGAVRQRVVCVIMCWRVGQSGTP